MIGMMAKYWQPGKVKTRLGAEIGMDRSARLHQVLVHHLMQQLGPNPVEHHTGKDRRLSLRESCDFPPLPEQTFQWVMSPPGRGRDAQQQLEAWGQQNWEIVDQGEGDLGARMQRWFQQVMNSSPATPCQSGAAVLIGADCPLLSADDIQVAMDRMGNLRGQCDVVLGPAADGGYYLIGLQSPWRDPMERLFRDIQWSQPDVLEVTCRRAQKSGLTVSLLSVREDIDTVDELATLRQTLGLESSQADVALGRLRDEIERIMSPETHPTPSFPPHSATNK